MPRRTQNLKRILKTELPVPKQHATSSSLEGSRGRRRGRRPAAVAAAARRAQVHELRSMVICVAARLGCRSAVPLTGRTEPASGQHHAAQAGTCSAPRSQAGPDSNRHPVRHYRAGPRRRGGRGRVQSGSFDP